MSVNPRIELPSNLGTPSLKASSSRDSTGTVTCCNRPGTSVNCRSTNLTFSSCIFEITSDWVYFLGFSFPPSLEYGNLTNEHRIKKRMVRWLFNDNGFVQLSSGILLNWTNGDMLVCC